MNNKNSVMVAKEKSNKAHKDYMKRVRETTIPIGDILDYMKEKHRLTGFQKNILTMNEIESYLTKYAEGRLNE